MCSVLCIVRLLLVENVLSHISQMNIFLFVWILRWFCKSKFVVNVLLHWWQWYILCSLCECICLSKLSFLVKVWLHFIQMKCKLWCSLWIWRKRRSFLIKDSLQTEQSNGTLVRCFWFNYLWRYYFLLNVSSQTVKCK